MEKKIFSINRAANADILVINGLVNSAYRGESSRSGWTTEADLLDGQRTDAESLAEFIKDAEQRQILVLRENKEILASVCIEKHERDRCYLGMLTVAPAMQNRGLGKILMDAAENEARLWGATHMTITVIQLRHTLIDWYKRRGYKATGEVKPFPYGEAKFGIPKREDLRFEVFEKQLPL